MPRHVASARRRRSTQSPSSGLQGCPLLPLRRVARALLLVAREAPLLVAREAPLWGGSGERVTGGFTRSGFSPSPLVAVRARRA